MNEEQERILPVIPGKVNRCYYQNRLAGDKNHTPIICRFGDNKHQRKPVLCNNENCPLEHSPRPEKEIRKKFRFYIQYDYNPVEAGFMVSLFPYLREEWREYLKKVQKESGSIYLLEKKEV